MSIWKKAISAGATAALLGSLFATALAPTVSAAAVLSPTSGSNLGGTVVSISGVTGINVNATVDLNCGGTVSRASVTSVSPDGTALTFVVPDVSPFIGLCAIEADPDGAGTLGDIIGLPGFFATGSAPGPVTLTPNNGKDATVVTLSAPGQYIATSGVTLTVGTTGVTFIRNNGETATFAIPTGLCSGQASLPATLAVTMTGIVGIPGFTCNSTASKFAMAPTSGPTGTVVQLSYDPGTFDLLCRVSLAGGAGIAPTSIAGDGSKLTFVIPSGTATGTYAVTVAQCTSGTTGTGGAGNFVVTGTAGGANVSPATVSTDGGTVVQVTGTGFSGLTRIALSTDTTVGTACYLGIVPTSTAADGKSLTFVMPKESLVDSNGTTAGGTPCALVSRVAYVWTTIDGGANYVRAGSVTYVPPAGPPSVTSVSPNTGSRAGGNTVTITGTGFVSGATVAFGTTAATSVTFVSATSLTVVAPSGVGVVPVTVRNPDGQSGQLPGAYTYTDTGYVCGAGTALNVTTTGPFGTATVVAKPNQYVTYKFSCGVAGAGQKYTILGAKKNANGTWGAFTAVTSRIADSGGNVYYYVRTTGGQWWSFRMQIASSFSPARQARWL